MPNRRLSLLLFLSSYSPVFALLALRAWGRVCPIVILSLLLLAAAAAGIAIFLSSARRTSPHQIRVLSVEQRDSDLAAYLVGYLLPFVAVLAADWRDVAALALFFVFVGIVYANSRMIFVNPLLALFGYHLVLVRATTLPEGDPPREPPPQWLVTRRSWVRSGDRLRVRPITAEAFFAFPSDDERQ